MNQQEQQQISQLKSNNSSTHTLDAKSKIPIYAKISSKITNKVNSSLHEQKNGFKEILMKPKSKLYKGSLVEKKKIPTLKSGDHSNGSIDSKHNLILQPCVNANNNRTNSCSNNITINETVNSNKIVNKKPVMVENTTELQQQDDDSLYKKVYLNNSSKNKYKSQLPKYNASEITKQTNESVVTMNNPPKTIDTSINTLKESINNFKKKFSNTIKFDANNSNANSNNNENIDSAKTKNESLINNETNNEINTDLLNNKNHEEQPEEEKENIYDNFIPIDDTNNNSSIQSAENKNSDNLKSNESESNNTTVTINNSENDPATLNVKMSFSSNNNQTNKIKLNESPSLNSFKTDKFDCDLVKTNNESINNLNKQPSLLSQGELIEECKNSLNELIKASKWSNNNSTPNNTTIANENVKSQLAPPSIPTRIKYLDKTKLIGSFPSPNNNNTDLNRFNNYDNLIQIKSECNTDLTSAKDFYNCNKLVAPLATTSELDETLNTKFCSENTDLQQRQIQNSKSSFQIQQHQLQKPQLETNRSSKQFISTRSTSANNLKYFTSLNSGFSIVSTKTHQFYYPTTTSTNSNETNRNFHQHHQNEIHLNSIASSSSSSNISNKSLETTNLTTNNISNKNKSNQRCNDTDLSEINNYKTKDENKRDIVELKCIKSKQIEIELDEEDNNNININNNNSDEYDYNDDIESNSFSNNKCKRFSTTSEILIKKSTNQDSNAINLTQLNSSEINNTNKKLRSRRSTPGLNCSESLSSFKSINTTTTQQTINTTSTNNTMLSNQFSLSRNKSLVRLSNDENKSEASNQDQQKTSTLKTNKKHSSGASTTSSSSSSSNSSSWFAQSFRKAFGKTDSIKQKKLNKGKQNAKMMSSLSINNCATVLTTGDELLKTDTNRNSCSNSSKRSSLSDDENNQSTSNGNTKPTRGTSNKLSLLPNNFNDSDSEFDDEIDKSAQLVKAKNSSLISKRSYRSESELVTKFQQQQSRQANLVNQTSNDDYNYDTFNSSKKLTTLNEINTNNNIINNNNTNNTNSMNNTMNTRGNNLIKNNSKLTKTHKSVNSLLAPPNENQFYKLQEINQSFYNQTQIHQLMNQSSSPTMTKAISMQKFNKCNCKLNDNIVTDLKKKLNIAENKLTDIRLEALSSVHQVDQLKDYLDKMKNEMIALKSENQILKKYIKDIKLQKLNITNQINDNSNEMNNSQIEQMFESFNTNLSNYYYSYNFLLGDENESLLRKALITVECSYELKSNNQSIDLENISLNTSLKNDFFAYEICTVNIDSKLKWHLMDGIISYVFKRYLNKLDSHSLGLDKNSIDKYYIGEIVRKINDTKVPDLLPFGYLVGDNCTIRIILKDNNQNLDSLCYETLMPKYLLEDYVRVLENHRLVAISSMYKFGKTYLMRKLAQFLSKNSNKEIDIIYYDLNDIVNEKDSCSSLSHLTSSSSNLNNNLLNRVETDLISNLESKLINLKDKSAMILLDNFSYLFSNNNSTTTNNNEFYSKLSIKIIHTILRLVDKNKLYLILTLQETNLSLNQNWIEFNKYFKWIYLNHNHSNFLHMYLNRRLMHYQVNQSKAKESCVIMEKVVSYINDIFKLVNELIIKLDYPEHVLTPVNFLNLPFGVEASEKWFIELWNYTLIPFLNDLIKMKLIMHDKNDHSSDGFKSYDTSLISDWVVNNYVWNKNLNKNNSICTVNQRLFRLKSFNEFLNGNIRISSSSSDDLEIQSTINNENCSNKHLISMLNRLQKAAAQNHLKDDASSGFCDSSNSSNTSPKANSPTNIPIIFITDEQPHMSKNTMRPLLMNKITTKNSKIESAL